MELGLTQAIKEVFEFPHKLSLKILVSLLSLKGIWAGGITCMKAWRFLFPFLFSAAKAAMQFPRAEIDLLIFFASSSLVPLENVFDNLSLPAKSTIVNSPFL